MLEFNESLIAFDLQAKDAKEVIDLLAGKMYAQGLVTAEYGAQTWEREMDPSNRVADQTILHCLPTCRCRGSQSVCFGGGGSAAICEISKHGRPGSKRLDVMLVFMLANRDPEEQIQTLRNLAVLFGQPEKLVELRDQTTLQGVESWLRRELRLS